jgi:hypothetical protein
MNRFKYHALKEAFQVDSDIRRRIGLFRSRMKILFIVVYF